MTPLVIALIAVGAFLLLGGPPAPPPASGLDSIDAINRLLDTGRISGTKYDAQVPGFVPTLDPPVVPHLKTTPQWNVQLGGSVAPPVPVGIAGVMATAYRPNVDVIQRAAAPSDPRPTVNTEPSPWQAMPATIDQVPQTSTLLPGFQRFGFKGKST